jgi:acyl-CoA thioester hydrolase
MLESVRGQFFRHLGRSFRQCQKQDTIFPVIECRLQYKGPARYDDSLAIEVGVLNTSGVRLNFNYRVLKQDGLLVVEAATFHACARLNEKPKHLPKELLFLFEPYALPAGSSN